MEPEDLICRPLKYEDLPIRLAWINNTAFSRMLDMKPPITLEATKRWFSYVDESREHKEFTFEEEGKICAFGGLKFSWMTAKIYVFVYPSLVNLGVSTAAIKSLCRYGFEEIELDEICLNINPDDLVARRIYEKCGFRSKDPTPEGPNATLEYSLDKFMWAECFSSLPF